MCKLDYPGTLIYKKSTISITLPYYHSKVIALYYTTIENLPFDFTIKLCYTIIREGGEEPLSLPTDGPTGSWTVGAGAESWKMSSA